MFGEVFKCLCTIHDLIGRRPGYVTVKLPHVSKEITWIGREDQRIKVEGS